jgi:hypothetical protein
LKRIETGGDGDELADADDATTITYDGQDYVVVGVATRGEKQNQQLKRHDMATILRRDGIYLSKLTIRRVTENDAGQYVCSTTNHAGYTYRQAYLIVRTGNVNIDVALLVNFDVYMSSSLKRQKSKWLPKVFAIFCKSTLQI